MRLKNNPTLKSSKIRVGLTIGDPAGIGAAITIKALKQLKAEAEFTVIGNRFVLAAAAKLLKTSLPAVKFINLDNIQEKQFKFGKVSSGNGRASLDYLDIAIELLKNEALDCLVTCPISKEAINLAGEKSSGHTEYLAKHTNSPELVMMLLNDKLKFSLLTRHIRLQDVAKNITPKKIEDNILKTAQGLKALFLIKQPRLVVCGLNPHASDNGVIGMQENNIFVPVVKKLNKKLKRQAVTGPISADVAIAQAAKHKFDGVIAAYHDQALIALKLTGAASGVNLTLGLPFVRTSPLHGTAFDIAAQPVSASPHSLIAAIKLAIKCTFNQKKA